MSGKIFAAIDIGTTSISLLAAEVTEKGARVLGSCTKPSRGIRKGVVVNIEEAVHSIRSAVSEVEAATGRKIPSAVIGITGLHITNDLAVGLKVSAAQCEEGVAPLHDRTVRVPARFTETIKNAFGYKDFLAIDQKKKKGVSYV